MSKFLTVILLISLGTVQGNVWQQLRQCQAKVTRLEDQIFAMEQGFVYVGGDHGLPPQQQQKTVQRIQNCADVKKKFPGRKSGVYKIFVQGLGEKNVYCKMDGKIGWTVLQRRYDGKLSFKGNFARYKHGFGKPKKEYWAGLEFMHSITAKGRWTLRIELESYKGISKYAEYKDFSIGSGPGYVLSIGQYSGTAGDSLSNVKGCKFSTPDVDQDRSTFNCAARFQGAFWYRDCFKAHLNAFRYANKLSLGGGGVIWNTFDKIWYLPLRKTMMMIKPQ